MEWEDDDFESQVMVYSEIKTVSKDQLPPPRTILQYQKRIQSNNNISIFDADYSFDEPNGHNSAVEKSKNGDNLNHDDIGVFKDEKVTFVLSGRGRGGRNHIFKPGEAPSSKTLNEEDEIRQQIRKIAPMGYSNEITERYVKAQKMAKVLEQNGTENIPNSPSLSNSPISTKAISEEISSSPVRPRNKDVMKNQSPHLSEKSMSHSTSDPYSSEYFTSNDLNVTPSPSNSSPTESDKNREDSSEEDCPTVTTNIPKQNVNNGAIPKRPVPLSVMLQRSREERKRRQLNIEEVASQRKIAEILKQDLRQAEIRKKAMAENSSASSSSSWDDLPLWRQRNNNSPPKYAWGQMKKRREPRELNIDSFDDFPSLK